MAVLFTIQLLPDRVALQVGQVAPREIVAHRYVRYPNDTETSRWRDLAVTRWREDPTRDGWGGFCYVRDVASGSFWSVAHQPSLVRA